MAQHRRNFAVLGRQLQDLTAGLQSDCHVNDRLALRARDLADQACDCIDEAQSVVATLAAGTTGPAAMLDCHCACHPAADDPAANDGRAGDVAVRLSSRALNDTIAQVNAFIARFQENFDALVASDRDQCIQQRSQDCDILLQSISARLQDAEKVSAITTILCVCCILLTSRYEI